MSRGRIDAVIVGADRVAANGRRPRTRSAHTRSRCSRGATRYRSTWRARYRRSTYRSRSGADIPIEERAAEEVLATATTRWAPAGIGVENPVFDVTPAELVTALITEKGVVPEPTREKIAQLMKV